MIDQLQITEMLVTARSMVTCDHIVMIARYANTLIKAQILSKWASKCVDKENRGKIEKVLSPFDYLCIAKDFE